MTSKVNIHSSRVLRHNFKDSVVSPEDLLKLRFSSSFDEFVDRVPEYVILSFFEQSVDDLRKLLGKEELVSYNWLGNYVKVVFFSYMGRSLALFVLPIGISISSMLLEELIYCGALYFLVIGFAGSLSDKLVSWDLVVPSYSFMDDEVFYLYSGINSSSDRVKQYSSPMLCEYIYKELDSRYISYHKGACWTISIPYFETRDRVSKYREEGILCVDMELASLSAIASYRGVHLSSLFTISDSLSEDKWVPYFTNKSIKKERTILLDIALGISSKI